MAARSARRCWPMAWKSLAPSPRKSCGDAVGYQRTLPKPRRATASVVVGWVWSELLLVLEEKADPMASQSVARAWETEAPRRSRREGVGREVAGVEGVEGEGGAGGRGPWGGRGRLRRTCRCGRRQWSMRCWVTVRGMVPVGATRGCGFPVEGRRDLQGDAGEGLAGDVA